MPSSAPYIQPEQLCIGLYVQLELSWWQHGFAFSHFKIRDQAQLDSLRQLNLPRVRYDPARSDCQPLPLETAPAERPAAPVEVDPQQRARDARVAQLSALRTRLAEVDKRFIQTGQQIKALNQTLRGHPENTMREAGEIVSAMVDTILGAPGVVLHSITGKAAEESYYHALNVTVLSLLLGRQLGLDSEACHILGLGALLHDVGQLEIPSKVLLKREPLTRPEQQFRQLHCAYGQRFGERLMFDDDVVRILLEHHEHCDGSGYPRGLHEPAIGRLSRVVAITNQFDNLCNPLDPKTAMSPSEALAMMFKHQRARFDEVALKAFIRCMGIYPPGSLVQLDDQRYGLVLGMNPGQPLKPTLIVYDADVPKNEALILDLTQEPRLAIEAGLRPAQLPREALEYLNPRQQLSYFVEPSQRR